MSALQTKTKPKSKKTDSHHHFNGASNTMCTHSPSSDSCSQLSAFYSAGPVFGLSSPIQTKVVISRPGDPYEKEADSVADRVIAGEQIPGISHIPPGGLGSNVVQNQKNEEEQEETQVQAYFLQLQEEEEEKEPEEISSVQTQLLQCQPEEEEEQEEAHVQAYLLQLQEEEEEKEPEETSSVQTQFLQRQPEEEEEQEETQVQANFLQMQATDEEKEPEEETILPQPSQQQAMEEEETEKILTQPILLQRQVMGEEEPEKISVQSKIMQRQVVDEEIEEPSEESSEEELLQTRFSADGTNLVQRHIQTKSSEECPECLLQAKLIQKQDMEQDVEEEEEQKEEIVQTSQSSGGNATKSPSMASSVSNATDNMGSGESLKPSTQRVLESRIGMDLSDVRIHNDSASWEATRALKARSFTHGNDIWLGPGESQDDLRLMAHEVTHVLQQDGIVHCKPVSDDEDQEENQPEESVETPSEERPVAIDNAMPGQDREASEARVSPADTAEVMNMATPEEIAPSAEPMEEGTTEAAAQPTPPPAEANVPLTVALEEAPSESQAAAETAVEEPAAQAEKAGAAVDEIVANEEAQVNEVKSAGMAQADSAAEQAEADPLPSLIDFLGPIEEVPSSESQGEITGLANNESQTYTDMEFATGLASTPTVESGFETEPTITVMRMPEIVSTEADAREEGEYDPEEARAEVQSIVASITGSSEETQRRVEMQAEDVRANLISNAEILRQSVQSQVAASVASLHGAFDAERASLEVSLETTSTQVATTLEACRAEAVTSGEAAKARLTNLFAQHRTNVQTTVQDNVAAAEEIRTEYATEVHERTQTQATEARRRGQAKASSYPDTERGRVQANAARGVANETAQKIEEREPEAVEAIEEATVDLPEQFQEQGQEVLNGFDERLPDLLDGVDQQVQAVTSALDEQATQAYQQLNTMGTQMLEQLNALETAAVARAEAVGPQVEAQIDSRLEIVQTQIDEATPQAIGQVSQIGDEAAQVLLNMETPDVEASHEFANQIQTFMTGIADTASDGLQQTCDQTDDEFYQAETATIETLQEIEQQTADELYTMRETTNTTLTDFIACVEENFGEAIFSLEESFTETETEIEEDLSQAVEELAADFGQALQDAEEEIINAVDEGLSKNDEALDQLGPQMQEAADDAAWDYDHPILSTLASIGAIVAGVIVGIVALVLLVVAVIFLVKALLVVVAFSAILTAVVKIVLVVGGIALVAYGVYEAYQERIRAGEEGGWATFGKALLDFAGVTDIYRAVTTPGLSLWERFLLSAKGSFKLAGTLLLVYCGWRFVRAGGLRNAWRGLMRSLRPFRRAYQKGGLRGIWRHLRGRPVIPVKGPAGRHYAGRVTQGTLTRGRNTVIEPSVDVAGDVAAINAGKATRIGNNYIINGRTYGVEPNGTLYPISGPGFHQLNRGAFKALGIYNKFGNTSRATDILNAMNISSADRDAALSVWRILQGG
ncbi:MAG: DUF4157 domain-containing protein [bacterium]